MPLGSRIGCAPIFAIVIPNHPVEKNRNRNHNREIAGVNEPLH